MEQVIKKNQVDSLGRAQGYWELFSEEGILQVKAHYENGMRHGKCEYFDNRGKIFWSGYYEHGVKIGKELEFFNATLEETNYSEGIQHGLQRITCLETGEILQESHYFYGEKITNK